MTAEERLRPALEEMWAAGYAHAHNSSTGSSGPVLLDDAAVDACVADVATKIRQGDKWAHACTVLQGELEGLQAETSEATKRVADKTTANVLGVVFGVLQNPAMTDRERVQSVLDMFRDAPKSGGVVAEPGKGGR